ncbi:hypothetical protein ACIA7S_28680 [Streptomyces sp. NPDC051643]|uniref:hypothetical protein n=1 Tax=Streptomyces sp. NPDC051643 TaxID=3365665 RepID=UPI0037B5A496
MPDLDTPKETREFLALCLLPNRRGTRTPKSLHEVMPEWTRTALHEHAPHLAPLLNEARRLEGDVKRAHAAYVKAMRAWIEGEDAPPPAAADSPTPEVSPYVAALRATADRYDELLAGMQTADPQYRLGASHMIHGLRHLADEAEQRADGEAGKPTELRWGLDDVLWGDDDTVTVCLSGPVGEPYRLELDPGRTAALRQDLAGPPAEEEQPLPEAASDPAGAPEVIVSITRYTVSVLPADDLNHKHFALTVELKPRGWIVHNGHEYYGPDGTTELSQSTAHHFADYDDALDLARRTAPGLAVMGRTATEAYHHTRTP